MSANDDGSITVTLVHAATGQSESIPVQANGTTVQELTEWAGALFGLDGAGLVLTKDGQRLSVSSSSTLGQAGVQNGDLIAVASAAGARGGAAGPSAAAAPAAAATGGGGASGLDFSSLLGGSAAAAPASQTASSAGAAPPEPTYYPGMNLQEAQAYNPHPEAFCRLLLEKEHLRKELNYYNPRLAALFQQAGMDLKTATNMWRQEMVKGGIESALRATQKFHQETKMKERLQTDPNDAEAKAYFAQKEKKRLIDEQYHHVLEQYPESMGRVLMLYISAKINGHEVQAFCDSGAQATIMSKRLAYECELGDYIDERMAGVAVGVGTGKILGRIHMVNLQIGEYWFPCTITVMDDPPAGVPDMKFLLGLDMLKRHTCLLDLEHGCLKFRISPGKYMETPFLHEKDLSAEQGGTKGFDVEKANAEALKESMKEDNGDDDDDKMDEDKKKDEMEEGKKE